MIIIFSNDFLRHYSEYKSKLCSTIIESVKNVSKLQARAIFLQKCQNNKITPTTMTIKPLENLT